MSASGRKLEFLHKEFLGRNPISETGIESVFISKTKPISACPAISAVNEVSSKNAQKFTKSYKNSHKFTKTLWRFVFRQGISLFFEKIKPIRCLSFSTGRHTVLRRQESKFVDASGFRIKCGMTIRNKDNYAKQTQFNLSWVLRDAYCENEFAKQTQFERG